MKCNTFGYSKAVVSQSGIYAIPNRASGRIYIGYTQTGFGRRWGMHISNLRCGTHPNAPLQRDWIEFREESFSFHILEVIHCDVPKEYFLLREWMYIKAMSNPYNDILKMETGILRRYIRQGVLETVPPIKITPNDLLGYTPTETDHA